jgi:hypothetical protein
MIYTVSIDRLEITNINQFVEYAVKSYFPISVEIITSGGGKVYPDYLVWYLGAKDCPIENIKFSQTKEGPSQCDITLENIDFIIPFQGNIIVRYNGIALYRGYIKQAPDATGGTIKAESYLKKFDTVRYNGTFTNKTIKEKWEIILSAKGEEAATYYNEGFMDTTFTSAIASVKYEYQKLKEILKDDIALQSNRWAGINADGFLYFLQPSTVINHRLYEQDYSKLETKNTTDKIKYTRLQVFRKKSGATSAEYVGEVGYSAPYPPVGRLERITGILEDTLTTPEGLTNTEALEYAYGLINIQTESQTVSIDMIDLRRHFVKIGDRVQALGTTEKQLLEIIDCDSITGWTDATLETSIVFSGDNAVKLSDGGKYTYQFPQRYDDRIEFLGIMLYSTVAGVVYISYGTNDSVAGDDLCGVGLYGWPEDDTGYIFTESHTINITVANAWNFYKVPFTDGFKIVGFDIPTGASIYVDAIHVFGYVRKKYIDNIVRIDYNFNKNNFHAVDITLGEYKERMNISYNQLQSKVSRLENTQRS